MNTSKATINLIIFLNFVTLKASLGSKDVTSSVYGGKPAGFLNIRNGEKTYFNDGQFPYNIEITEHNKHICGGVLLKKDIVLTAAHCFKDTSICAVKILAGSYTKLDTKSETVQIRDIYDMVAHHMYDWKLNVVQPNDIALVFLKEAFELTPFVQTATLATKMQRNEFMGTTVVIMGYGRMEDNKKSTKLLLAGVTMLKKRECDASLKKEILTNGVICVKCKYEVCTVGTGDSGSPLVKIDKRGKHIILGIATFVFYDTTTKITEAFKPAVYTDVAEYHDWLTFVKRSKKPKSNKFFNWCKKHILNRKI